MKTLLNLKGIITVLNTPFAEDGSIHLPSLKKNVEYAIQSNVSGFLIPAMAAEVYKLSEDERDAMLKTVIESNKGKIKIIGGIYSDNPEVRKRMAKKYIDLGCDGLLINIPFIDSSSFCGSISEIAALNPPFLMIQDWSPSGFGIPLDIIKKLYDEIDCFRSIKVEVVPAGVKYTQIKEMTGGRLHVSGGWAVQQMIEALDRGVDAFMPTGMHEIYTHIFQSYTNGNRSAAKELFEQILPILAFSNQHLDISINFFKRLLYKQKIYPTPYCRKPILEFDAIHERIADELITIAIETMKKLKK